MSEKGYLLAWGVYLLCSLGLLGCFWYLTRPFGRLRLPLRALATVFLLLPWSAGVDVDTLAPAWLTLLFDAFLKQDVPAWRAGLPLLVAMVTVLLLVLVWQRKRRRVQ